MRNNLFLQLICAAVIALTTVNAVAQTATTDLQVNGFKSPTLVGSPTRTPEIVLGVTNKGTTDINHFNVKIMKDGVMQFEENVNQDIPKNEWVRSVVKLKNRVTLDYGTRTSLKAFVKADGDENTDNDTMSVTVFMPKLVPFPFRWNEATAQSDYDYKSIYGLGWDWNDDDKAFYISGLPNLWAKVSHLQIIRT